MKHEMMGSIDIS